MKTAAELAQRVRAAAEEDRIAYAFWVEAGYPASGDTADQMDDARARFLWTLRELQDMAQGGYGETAAEMIRRRAS